MGYAASAANLFRALTNPDSKWLQEEAMHLLWEFKLYAIILADPEKDPEFYQQMKDNFHFFDRLTGNNLMFVAIVKPKDLNENSFSKFLPFAKKEHYKMDLIAEETPYPEIYTQAICSLFKINYDLTPVILLSNDLRLGNFYFFQTNLESLETHLIDLRRIADNLYTSTDLQFLSLKHKLLSFKPHQTVFDKSIPKLLSELLSSIESGNFLGMKSINDFNKNAIQERLEIDTDIEKFIEVFGIIAPILSKKSENLKRPNINNNSIQQKNENILSESISKYSAFTLDTIPEIIKYRWANIEPSTTMALRAAIKLKELEKEVDEFEDYSPYTFQICKSFEIEINLSIIQLMRNFFGISMPAFYNRFCPEKDRLNISETKDRPIFLNNSYYEDWLPPGLGESRIAHFLIRQKYPEFNNLWENLKKQDILQTQWRTIAQIRNKSAHTSPINRRLTKELEYAMIELHQNDILNDLTNLKLKLKR